jgi:hypothetical protein
MGITPVENPRLVIGLKFLNNNVCCNSMCRAK